MLGRLRLDPRSEQRCVCGHQRGEHLLLAVEGPRSRVGCCLVCNDPTRCREYCSASECPTSDERPVGRVLRGTARPPGRRNGASSFRSGTSR